MGEFVIKKVATGVKFDLRAANGQIIATSEVYKTPAACRKGIQSVSKNAPKAPLEDQTVGDAALPNPKFELYQDKAGLYRFRLRARNGGIIAVSEGYSTRQACLDGIESVKINCTFSEKSDFFGK